MADGVAAGVAVEVVPAMSFLDLAWVRLGVDPLEEGVRLVDGHRFDVAAAAVRDYGTDRVAVAIDVRGGRATGDGWDAEAPTEDALEAIRRLADVGVTTFEVTAIERDGLLQGPDLELLSGAVELGAGRIIASAGITSTDDIAAVRGIGCAGAIVGRALYEGQLSLRDALSAAAAS